jgi:hypothetical protein
VTALARVGAAEAFWVTGPGTGEVRRARLRRPADGEALVRALWSGISRGTESLVFSGRVPASEHRRMRAPHQEGELPAPVKYGYSSVGVVESGPPELVGRTVFCLYPHQSAYVVPASALIPLPDGVEPARAVLSANLETAVNALWDAGLGAGDRVAVVGGGVVGCLTAWLAARTPGTRVELVDVDPARAAVARALGVEFARPGDASGAADLVFHASGQSEGLACALGLAGFEARVVELSWYGDRPVTVPLGEAFHAGRLTLLSSQVGQVSPGRRPRWDHRRRLMLAVSLLTDPRLDVLLGEEHPLEALPGVMARLAAPAAGVLCERVRYG